MQILIISMMVTVSVILVAVASVLSVIGFLFVKENRRLQELAAKLGVTEKQSAALAATRQELGNLGDIVLTMQNRHAARASRKKKREEEEDEYADLDPALFPSLKDAPPS